MAFPAVTWEGRSMKHSQLRALAGQGLLLPGGSEWEQLSPGWKEGCL